MQNNEEKSALKYGKVHNYDGYLGEIITEDTIYYFDKTDVLNNELLENEDWVRFNGKSEDEFPQAYYITKQLIYKSK